MSRLASLHLRLRRHFSPCKWSVMTLKTLSVITRLSNSRRRLRRNPFNHSNRETLLGLVGACGLPLQWQALLCLP